ncbi:MAG: hypothetical protein C5B49_08220 [Bdellovibrio sp.]|nr:MAG: hypothetical protein C5B49_08220 [Bdellovibrio sp.]
MAQQKLLHQERVIRTSGVLLMIAPFANFYLTIDVVNLPGKWAPAVLFKLATGISPIHWILWVASFIVGTMMLKGKRSSWISVLAVLGFFIVFDVLQFKKDIQRGWTQPVVSLAVNVSIFMLVYLQEFRQASAPGARAAPAKSAPEVQVAVLPLGKSAAAVTPIPTRSYDFAINSKRFINHTIDFEGYGGWAKVVLMTENEFVVEAFKDPPPNIENEAVEIFVDQAVIHLKMTSRWGKRFVFRYESVRPLNSEVKVA